MMKKSCLAALCLALPLGGFAVSNAENGATIQEKDVRIERLETEVRDLRSRLDATVEFLRRQSAGAASLQQSLDLSAEEGFTLGINPRSREVLLDGFHGFLEGLQQELPAAAAQASPKARGGKIN